jgi:hypothetical protein
MCPLGDKCPRVQKIRWPYSNIKSISKFGETCPYAHHYMELQFPETIQSRINATKGAKEQTVKKSGQTIRESFKPGNAKENGRGIKYYETEEMTLKEQKELKAAKEKF